MRRFFLVCVACLLSVVAVQTQAQVYVYPAPPTAVLTGSFTVATLPDPAQNKARYAFVTDLGGGADMVLSDGGYWKHIRQGQAGTIAGGGGITLTPLISPPILVVSGTGLASTSITILTQNLYPGATFRIIIPGALAALATAGINVQGVAGSLQLPLVGGTWQDVQWNGTSLVKIAGGPM
jgi:hypothetical protein